MCNHLLQWEKFTKDLYFFFHPYEKRMVEGDSEYTFS